MGPNLWLETKTNSKFLWSVERECLLVEIQNSQHIFLMAMKRRCENIFFSPLKFLDIMAKNRIAPFLGENFGPKLGIGRKIFELMKLFLSHLNNVDDNIS